MGIEPANRLLTESRQDRLYLRTLHNEPREEFLSRPVLPPIPTIPTQYSQTARKTT